MGFLLFFWGFRRYVIAIHSQIRGHDNYKISMKNKKLKTKNIMTWKSNKKFYFIFILSLIFIIYFLNKHYWFTK